MASASRKAKARPPNSPQFLPSRNLASTIFIAASADGRPSKIATETHVIMAMVEAIDIPDAKLCKETHRQCEGRCSERYDPDFVRENFCSVIRGSRWKG
jgi:hypothetical protein